MSMCLDQCTLTWGLGVLLYQDVSDLAKQVFLPALELN